jgi:hypothetical protein
MSKTATAKAAIQRLANTDERDAKIRLRIKVFSPDFVLRWKEDGVRPCSPSQAIETNTPALSGDAKIRRPQWRF